jgi:hypothetical protein
MNLKEVFEKAASILLNRRLDEVIEEPVLVCFEGPAMYHHELERYRRLRKKLNKLKRKARRASR